MRTLAQIETARWFSITAMKGWQCGMSATQLSKPPCRSSALSSRMGKVEALGARAGEHI
jgi:hypothetical protein